LLVASLVDALQKVRFRVALEGVELVSGGGGLRSQPLLDLG